LPANKLILLPTDAHAGIEDCSQLASRLLHAGLIGAAREYHGGRFYPTGDQFLQLISFLGCSPSIELDPPQDSTQLDQAIAEGRFCHVQLVCGPTLRLRAEQQTRPPRCPTCGQPVTDWSTYIEHWQANPADTAWSCTHCGEHARLTDWAFGKTAGFGKVFVEISGIYPAEAVPAESLLQLLTDLTGSPWRYVYMKE